MFKKDIAYIDANDNEVTETVEINITSRQMIGMDYEGLADQVNRIQKLIKKNNGKATRKFLNEFLKFFDEIMHLGYGHTVMTETPNGDTIARFVPATNEEVDGFVQSDGYIKMVFELLTNAEEFEQFVTSVFDTKRQKDLTDTITAE